jgi:LysR family glycine cleavage system transcriptional activator
MIKRPPPLHALYAFEAVARLFSFAKAADELNVTRSAVSHRIQMLEDLLGAPAFERGRPALSLTPTGAAYLIVVRKALAALEDVAAQTGEHLSKTRITMTAPPTFARMVILPQLKGFLDQHPKIEIAVEISNSQLDYKAGEFDLDIRFGTGHHPGRECRILLHEVIFPVASPSYVEAHSLVSPSDLKNAQFLRSKLEPWLPWFNAAGLGIKEPEQGHRFEDLSLLYHAAAQGLGVALARASLVRPLLEEGALVPLFDVVARSDYAYYVLYERSSLDRPEVASLINWLLLIEKQSD